MTLRSDIYIIRGRTFEELVELACKLCEKVFTSNQRAILICDEAMQKPVIDEALWSFRNTAFIPHSIASSPSKSSPIVISDRDEQQSLEESETDALIYLSPALLEKEPRSSRRLILVPNIDASLTQARALFKSFKSKNQEIHSHDLR